MWESFIKIFPVITAERLLWVKMNKEDVVVFTINEKVHKVTGEVAIETSLNAYIRDYANLKATKFMCLEGGCGCCVVSARIQNPSTKKYSTYSINSCLVLVHACHGWIITTNEGIGSRARGYSSIQTTLAKFNGSQCGYCSSGMVMNMYSLTKSGKRLSKKDVEQSLSGNICRCTGYRPILDAFGSLASVACSKGVCDIEDVISDKRQEGLNDVDELPLSSSFNDEQNDLAFLDDSEEEHHEDHFVEIALAANSFNMKDRFGKQFYYAKTKKEIFEIFDLIGGKSYQLLCGGTAKGVYKSDTTPDVYIDITKVAALQSIKVSNVIEMGANVTLNDAMLFFRSIAKDQPIKFGYTSALADHIALIASLPIRNIASLAGNLSIKHEYQQFRSDVFVIFETVGATVKIEENDGASRIVSLPEYLKINMNKKLISSFCLPTLNSVTNYIKTYKISKRTQNSISYVNAGFLFPIDGESKTRVIGRPAIVYGGISKTFIHATKTENFLIGRRLLDNGTLQEALKILSDELEPTVDVLDASRSYRKGLALALFYKFVLSLSKNSKSVYFSGGSLLERPLSSGRVKFETNKKLAPITEPIPKLEIQQQCSGELQYINDMPKIDGQLYCAFVLTTVANARLKSVDASEILKHSGVRAFYTAKDIPGKNTFQLPLLTSSEYELLFCEGRVEYAGQPIGVIVADTLQLAEYAVRKVNVEYSNVEKPVLSVREVLAKGPKENIIPQGEVTPTAKKDKVKHVIEGSFEVAKQYHFTLEPQTCLSVPGEGGACLTVYSSTQWPQIVQYAVALALNIPVNSVYVSVAAVGGGYGSKFSRAALPACACAVAAFLQQKPVAMVMSIEHMMQAIGKRFPLYVQYKVGVDNDGVIQYLNCSMYEDIGRNLNDLNCSALLVCLPGPYDFSTWTIKAFAVKTNTPTNCYCRAPGSTESTATIETIMEHISEVIKKDAVSVRLKNIGSDDKVAADLIANLRTTSDFETRKAAVEKYNKENRWKKKGISLMPAAYIVQSTGIYNSAVSIYQLDGTVAISHGGIEVGQGINTKVAQVAAYTLGIDIKLIKVISSNTFVSPNNTWTGNSQTSQSVCTATVKCCKTIVERLEPIKKALKNPSWLQLIQAAYNQNVDLHASSSWTTEDTPFYYVNGVCVSEIELDILTGQHIIHRVDIIQDSGESLNPELDIGQVHGAFVMGMGYYLLEELIYSSTTGQLLTDRTWNYTPPGALDIPVDFRVALSKRSDSVAAVFGSKAIGEPPLLLSASFLLAFRSALESVRRDAGLKQEWFNIKPPLTPEFVFDYCANSIEQYRL
ncbi:probable aldehyde oxidase 2 isoform X2 [Nilaparvata lugens]|nr:probable aldehyde oxidase 2 isoform X2 [Nilaparvata lugens]